MRDAQLGPCEREPRVELRRSLERAHRGLGPQAPVVGQSLCAQPSQVGLVGTVALCRSFSSVLLPRIGQRDAEPRHDFRRDPRLNLEHVVQNSVEGLGPHADIVGYTDQRRDDANARLAVALRRPADAPLEHVVHAEVLADLCRGLVRAVVTECAVT